MHYVYYLYTEQAYINIYILRVIGPVTILIDLNQCTNEIKLGLQKLQTNSI
jgi:hypothetical protein